MSTSKPTSIKLASEVCSDSKAKASAQATVSALKRGLDILRCIEDAGGSLGLKDIAVRCDLPKPTALRLIMTLLMSGFLRRSQSSGNYLLGPAVIGLSRVFLSQMDLRSTARPALEKLAESLGGTTVLALREGSSMVVIEADVPQSTVAVARLGIGSRRSIIDSCIGQAYVAVLGQEERLEVLDQYRMEQPDRWKDPRKRVERSIQQMSQLGYCIQHGEAALGINAAATSLLTPENEILVLACYAPAFAFTEQRLLEEVGPRLVEVARHIAAEIGGAAPRSHPAHNMEYVSIVSGRK